MKVKIPLAFLLLLAGALGYLFGTESGRARRDVILVKLGRGEGGEGETAAVTEA